MKIGIIGCGYLGKALAKFWKTKGHELSVTTRKIARVADLELIADHVIVLTPETLKQFIAQQEVLFISVAPDSEASYASTYLETAQHVIAALPQTPHLKQIIYISSTSVYGEHQGNWVDETTPIIPFNTSSDCLYATEQTLLQASTPHLHICILRLGEIYGPEREISKRLLTGKNFAGTGDQITNLIHLEEIIRAADLALNKNLEGIYNTCNDLHLPRKELYETLCKEKEIPSIQWNPFIKSVHGGNKTVSNQKLKKMGFQCSNTKVG